jgi:Rieske Fe-S protein
MITTSSQADGANMKPYDRPTDSLPISRRTVIINTGLAAVAIAGLSSCTNYSTAPASEPSAAASGGSSSAAGPLTVKETDIPVGSGKIFPDVQTVITQPKKGEFKAFSAVCTHQGCVVDAVTTTINCPCHGSKYSITDGSVVNPPAPQPLPPKTIKVEGDTLTVT